MKFNVLRVHNIKRQNKIYQIMHIVFYELCVADISVVVFKERNQSKENLGRSLHFILLKHFDNGSAVKQVSYIWIEIISSKNLGQYFYFFF